MRLWRYTDSRGRCGALIKHGKRQLHIAYRRGGWPYDSLATQQRRYDTRRGVILYYTEPSLQSLYPALGPIMGGSLVTVSGIGFPSTLAHSVTCKFGASEPTLAQRVAASAYACTTPLTQSIHLSTMRLSFNGQDFTPIGIIYEYVQPTIINQVDPACGPVNGGTGIKITGGPFLSGRLSSLSSHAALMARLLRHLATMRIPSSA